MEKKSRRLARIHAYAEKLRFLPHLSEDERYLYAFSLAATPQERWERSQNDLRALLALPTSALRQIAREKTRSSRPIDQALVPVLRDIIASRRRLRVRR